MRKLPLLEYYSLGGQPNEPMCFEVYRFHSQYMIRYFVLRVLKEPDEIRR